MKNFIDILKRFNSKERFYLIGKALGNREFLLSEDFKDLINEALNLMIPSNDVFTAMDYHLDWIYGSLVLYNENESKIEENIFNKNDKSGKKMIYGTQEDSDLLICYSDNNIYNLIFIEAKGVMPWDIKQLFSKIKRLKDLFGNEGNNWINIKPYYLFMSPRNINLNDLSDFPEWALKNGKPVVLRLDIPQNLIKITRCDSKKKKDKNGDFWKIDNIKTNKNKEYKSHVRNSEYKYSSMIKHNTETKWANMITERYYDNFKNLESYFPEAYKFLKEISELEKFEFHMGTAVNMHFYYRDKFLFYFKFHDNGILPGSPVKFSPNYNLQLKHDAQVYSPELFFRPLLNKLDNSEILSKGIVERRYYPSGNSGDLDELYVYSNEYSKIFFDFCREIIADICGTETFKLFS